MTWAPVVLSWLPILIKANTFSSDIYNINTNNLMPMNDYILLGMVALISIGAGLYLRRAAKRYRRCEHQTD